MEFLESEGKDPAEFVKILIDESEDGFREVLSHIDVSNVDVTSRKNTEMYNFMKRLSAKSRDNRRLESTTLIPLYDSAWPNIKLGELIQRSTAASNTQWNPSSSMSNPLSERWIPMPICPL